MTSEAPSPEAKWQELTVQASDGGRVRLDAWLAKALAPVSRAKVQEMIEDGLVKVNNIKVVTGKNTVRQGDVIAYRPLERAKSGLEPFEMALEILFEDEHLLVVNKPAGIAVHPGAGETGATLVHGLLYHAKQLGTSRDAELEEEDSLALERPGIVHRLDKDTTGALVVAKTDAAHAHLSKQFQDKSNFRQYVALLNGNMPEGEWVRESWLYRDPRERTRFASLDMAAYLQKRDEEGRDLPGYRYARSLFKREKAYGPITLASIRLYTGRTHQIRIHAKDMGAPVLGDQTYGRPMFESARAELPESMVSQLDSAKRQMLHAWILGFTHPATEKWMQFEARLPEDFLTLLGGLQNL